MRFILIALFLVIFTSLVSSKKLRGDDEHIHSESTAVGITTASRGGDALSVVTSGSSANKLESNVKGSRRILINQLNLPANNILAA